jgi:PII-like signaling protein
MTDILLKIVVNEQQCEKREATCRKILTFLWEQGVPGATMKRGEAGLDFRGNLSYDFLEDTYFNDLPIIIESVMDQSAMEKIEGGLKKMAEHGQISRIEGVDEKSMDSHTHFAVKIYTRESTKLIKKDEYEKILQLLQKHQAIWATVTKAIAGYGSDRVIYGRHVFSPSEHLPLVIECVTDRAHLPMLLDDLKAVVSEGAVFTAPVDLIINK